MRRTARQSLLILLLSCGLASCGLVVSEAERMATVQTHVDNGEYRAAVIELRTILVNNPDHVEARLTLAKVLIGLNDLPTAEKELQRARELEAPQLDVERLHFSLLAAMGDHTELLATLGRDDLLLPEVDILNFKGRALLGLRNAIAAEDTYREWLATEPGSADAQVGLAKARALQGQADEALELLGAVVAENPDHTDGWLALGNIHYGLRDYQTAAEAFRRTVAANQPETNILAHIFALLGLSDCEILLGNATAARESVARLSSYAPGLAETLLQRARVYQLEGDYAAAGRELIELLNASPSDLRVMLMLATIQWRAGNIYQAQEYLNRIVALAPGNVRARKLLGQIQLQQQNTRLAVELLDPLLEQNQEDSELLGLLAIADMQRGETNVAMNRLRAAAELDSGNARAVMQLAEGYVRSGEPDRAVELLADHPRSTQQPFSREKILLAAYRNLGRVDDAIEEAGALVEANPGSVPAMQLAARFYFALGKLGEGRRLLEQAIELAPRNIQTRLMMAKLDLRESRHAKAGENFQAVFDTDSNNLTASLGLAQVALERGDRDQATELLERTFIEHPGEPLPGLVRANMYLDSGRRGDAIDVADSVVQAAGDDLSVVRSAGRVFFEAGDLNRAEQQFQRAVERSPQSVVLLLDLARSLMGQGKFDEAVNVTQRATAADPSSVPARVLRVLSMTRLGQLDEAGELADALAEDYPEDASVVLAVAEVLAAKGRYTEAIASFRDAAAKGAGLNAVVRETQILMQSGDSQPEQPLRDWITINGEDIEAQKMLAELYQMQGNRQAALQAYAALLELTPNDPVVLNNLAGEYQLAGDLAKAVEFAEAALALHPQSAPIADTVGWIYRDLGDYVAGVKHLREARRFAPHNGNIAYHLAVTLADAGATGEAREILAELLASDVPFSSRDDAEALLARL